MTRLILLQWNVAVWTVTQNGILIEFSCTGSYCLVLSLVYSSVSKFSNSIFLHLFLSPSLSLSTSPPSFSGRLSLFPEGTAVSTGQAHTCSRHQTATGPPSLTETQIQQDSRTLYLVWKHTHITVSCNWWAKYGFYNYTMTTLLQIP